MHGAGAVAHVAPLLPRFQDNSRGATPWAPSDSGSPEATPRASHEEQHRRASRGRWRCSGEARHRPQDRVEQRRAPRHPRARAGQHRRRRERGGATCRPRLDLSCRPCLDHNFWLLRRGPRRCGHHKLSRLDLIYGGRHGGHGGGGLRRHGERDHVRSRRRARRHRAFAPSNTSPLEAVPRDLSAVSRRATGPASG